MINTDKPSLPTHGQPAKSVATRASGNIPWTTNAIIIWPSEQDEKTLKCLLTKYKSSTLRALLLAKEGLERFETFRLDHILKDSNARYSEKDYSPPESYAQQDRADHAASPDYPILKRPTTREKAAVPEDGSGNTKTVKIEGKGIKFQIPLVRLTSSRDTNILPHQPQYKTLEDIDREIHLLLITAKQRPGRAYQIIDTEQPINFEEALKYLERLDIPSGVGKGRGVGVISASPSIVSSEWEDEEDEEAELSEVRVRKRHGRSGMRMKGTMTVTRNSMIDFARRYHIQRSILSLNCWTKRVSRSRVSSTQPFPAAIVRTGRLPIETLLDLDGSATSEAPEPSQSNRSSSNPNWFTFPPVPSKAESQPSQTSATKASFPSSLDLNDSLEKRIDSGLHLSSLPISKGKAKIEEGESKVQPPSLPRPSPSPRLISRGQYSRQITSSTKMVRRTREPLRLAVTRRRERQRSGSKAIAGDLLAGNLTIESTFTTIYFGHEYSSLRQRMNSERAGLSRRIGVGEMDDGARNRLFREILSSEKKLIYLIESNLSLHP
ncbi:hypothetical protein E6O75_ATG02289 [Venturia nashicola]|uniref:Uncharacterized protein n=1 Tax=Venturia nashicola TaxID=86259 RepID=A0A4Z1P576_9PEZI|nr:hypothetical protein E6O75_ATG02289 [Venturia nashicola]